MKITHIISLVILLIAIVQKTFSQTYLDSQKLNNEYKSLQSATDRAYAVPTSSTSTSTYSSRASTNNSSNQTSQTSSVTNYNFNNTERLNLNSYDRDQERIQKNNAKQQAIYSAFDAKEKQWREMMAASPLEKTGKNFDEFAYMGARCGLELYTCVRMLGGDAEGYDKLMNNSSAQSDAEYYKGSTKADCSGDCTETLDYANGTATYVGNTKNGAPQGKGTLNFNNGTSLTSNFNHGNPDGDVVLKYQDGNSYEGGYSNNVLNGFGKYTSTNYTSSGNYVNGKIAKTGQRTIIYKDGLKKVINYDNPTKSTINFVSGIEFVGTLDENDKYVNGRMNYKDGNYFVGEFKDGKRVKGTYYMGTRTLEGVFQDNGIGLKIGKIINTAQNYTTEGYYDDKGQLNGYGKYYDSNGNITEAIYTEGKYSGSMIFTFKNGDTLTGTSKYNGYKMYGLQKTVKGEFYMKALSDTGWIDPPMSEKDSLMTIYYNAIDTLSKARTDYELAIK